MFEDLYLEPEQIDLFREMVEAMRSVPGEERLELFVSRTFDCGISSEKPSSPNTFTGEEF
jgi:hypothetical protein